MIDAYNSLLSIIMILWYFYDVFQICKNSAYELSSVEVTLTQIWKSHHVFKFIWK